MGVERWVECPGYAGYEVSDHGRVRSLDRYLQCGSKERFHRGRLLRGAKNANGYMTVQLGRLGGRKMVHRLVAAAFIPKRLGKDVVNHLDFDPTNNRVENLEWVTQSENLFHASRGGRMHGPSPRVITDALVAAVRMGRQVGGSYRALAKQLAVSSSTIQKICERGANVRTVEGVRGNR